MADLRELLERVKTAIGPDRELDYAISMLGRTGDLLRDNGYTRLPGDEGWFSSTPVFAGAENIAAARAFTDNADEALYLIESNLPEWHVESMGEGPDMHPRPRGFTYDGTWFCHLHCTTPGLIRNLAYGGAQTLPYAIIAAMLSALITQDPS